MNEENKNNPLNMNMPASPSIVYLKGGRVCATGLTKLEAFTMAAMQGLCSNPNSWDVSNETIAGASVNLAKAALKALEKAE